MPDPKPVVARSPVVADPDDPAGSPTPAGVDPDEPAGPAPRPGPAGTGGGDAEVNQAGALLSQAMLSLARVVLRRGRDGAKRAASSGRVRLDLRQLRRDRDVMYQKLGREARHLLEGGEVQHPGLARGVERIKEIEARIAQVEADLVARRAAEVAAGVAGDDATIADAAEPGGPTGSDEE
ncbi:hypothetical protein L6R53_21950 [Myxococcota bacterium]|nr:hypothetical protein [Myxococcota bacterium]